MEEKEELVTKITITKQAEEAVSQIVARVNEGFDAGRVTRQDVASWVLTRFNETCGDGDVHQIRAEFFNEIALLENILKKAKLSGSVPEELKLALMGQANISLGGAKKNKRGLTNKLTNGQHDESGDAA
ncbi:hypothetical protein B9G69_004665 [Bdellovibrio sp. SKB1291214]|uniref:hypothetical protein n=1 Tax=Bdellovibrio sp. SKB1291214 TaxID=1732569 RepID=UPI000B5171BD|nr:hypothetical protein [Bdellovibrio sp. SKB1291214]UYL09866.1 hypothetical protein B9G69_004665 [Bdellovibrio sp. SKB1291214]